MPSYTISLRFIQPTVNSDAGSWAPNLNTDMQLIEQSITGDNGYAGGSGGISIAGLTVYALTALNGLVDQARQKLYPFVGALAADCTVTLPAHVKIGWALNATSGAHNVILTTGSGTAATIYPGAWTFFYCDGTNVTAPVVGFASALVDGIGQRNSTAGLKVGAAGDKVAFFGGTPVVKATVTGSKGANAALTSLMTALAAYGIVTDTTS